MVDEEDKLALMTVLNRKKNSVQKVRSVLKDADENLDRTVRTNFHEIVNEDEKVLLLNNFAMIR